MTEELENPVSVPEQLKADTEETLSSICAKNGQPITSSLLDIQKLAFPREKSLSWISNLECLYLTGPMIGLFDRKRKHTSEVACPSTRCLGRRILPSPFQEVARSFIAVSYTWKVPVGEPMSKGAYSVETRIDGEYAPNKVRDAVLDRVIRYAGYVACQYLWIDQECTDRENKREHEIAMYNMDLVYRYSVYPVAVLSAEVRSDEELAILACLLKGDFVHGNSTSPPLHPNRDAQQNARKALELLYRITSDLWWNRAWPYQEDYHAGTQMRLLIRCHPNLENVKRENKKIFGGLSGELTISSADFRRELTRFCFAYKDILDKSTCETVLRKATKYNVFRALSSELTGMKPMYPLIFRDIGSREIEQHSDMLAIAANCCDYSIRISAEELKKTEASLSISILALALLNGEVLVSTEDRDSWSLDTKIFQFLQERSLVLHQMDRQQLTFQKSCRLDKVKLTAEGICTTGHLWQLYKEIRISGSRRSSFEDTGSGLTEHERNQLRRLATHLDSGQEGMQYQELAERLRLFVKRDEDSNDAQPTFAKQYMDLMAREIVDAMYSETQILCLGRLVNGFFGSERSSYTGIFVVEAGHENPSYIFTSSSPAGDGPRQINKHVSLLVSPVGTQASYPPKMIARQWASGLCFFSGCPKIEVMLSWPESFMV